MRFVRETLLIASGLSIYGVVQAFVGARELEAVPPTTRQPNLPASNAMALAGFALTLVAYGWLGRAIARAGLAPGLAARRGALAGLIAGALSGAAQATLQADFFRSVALAYGLPEVVSRIMVVAIAVASPLVGAAAGAVVAWLAALLSRPATERRPEELV